MPSTMLCPNCGQEVLLGPLSPGEAVDCPSCGQLLVSATISPAPRPGTHVNAPPPATRMQPAGRSRPRITAVLIGGGLLIAAAGSAGYFLRSAPPVAGPLVTAEPSWEQSHRAELLQLKADAEAAILVGDLKTGYDKYAQLHTLAAAHRIQDPSLLSALQFADAARERVYTMLLAKPPAVPDASLETQATNNIIPATSPAGDAPANPPAITTITEPSPPDPLPAIRSLSPITPVPVSMPGHEADLQITAALENGIAFLLAHFKDGEITDSNPPGSMMHQGLNALCVYAVLHAGEGGALRDPRLNIHSDFMQKLIAKMKAHPMQPDANTPRQPVVYARSLRAAALAVYNRQEDQQALRADVAWLVKAARDGAYSYDDRYGGLSDNTKPDDLADLTEKGGSDSGSPDLNENGGSEPAPPDGSGSPGPFGGNPAHMYNVQRHWSVDRDMPGTLARSNPGTLAQQSWHIKAMDAWRQTTARRPPSRSGCRQFRRFPGGPGTHPKPGRISAPLAATGIPSPQTAPFKPMLRMVRPIPQTAARSHCGITQTANMVCSVFGRERRRALKCRRPIGRRWKSIGSLARCAMANGAIRRSIRRRRFRWIVPGWRRC